MPAHCTDCIHGSVQLTAAVFTVSESCQRFLLQIIFKLCKLCFSCNIGRIMKVLMFMHSNVDFSGIGRGITMC